MTDQPTPRTDDEYTDWTEGELNQMATVNAVTQADARADALRTPEIAALLEAEESED